MSLNWGCTFFTRIYRPLILKSTRLPPTSHSMKCMFSSCLWRSGWSNISSSLDSFHGFDCLRETLQGLVHSDMRHKVISSLCCGPAELKPVSVTAGLICLLLDKLWATSPSAALHLCWRSTVSLFQRGQMFLCGMQFFVFSGEKSRRLHRASSFFFVELDATLKEDCNPLMLWAQQKDQWIN